MLTFHGGVDGCPALRTEPPGSEGPSSWGVNYTSGKPTSLSPYTYPWEGRHPHLHKFMFTPQMLIHRLHVCGLSYLLKGTCQPQSLTVAPSESETSGAGSDRPLPPVRRHLSAVPLPLRGEGPRSAF